MNLELKQLIENDSELMLKFKEKAPGTFRHCEFVSFLTDSICSELEYVNRENLYIAAKLHDIGKIIFPNFFCENQKNENPINKLKRDEAFSILSRHVSDSILILLKYPEINRDILEIISQHHGTTQIHSLLKEDEDDKEKFRYFSCKPKTIEACILMICDHLEAKCKALFTKNKLNNINEIISTTIEYLINEKQLDILKIGELRKIKLILISEIENIYHKRIDYSEENQNEKTAKK